MCAGECMDALNANGELMCQSPGLNEFGILWNIRKDLCKHHGKNGLTGDKELSIGETVSIVLMDSLCAKEGALDWHRTIGHVTRLWCKILEHALPIMKDIVSPRVYAITQRRWRSQCLNNSLQPSALILIVELVLDGDILFEILEFFKKKICIMKGSDKDFFKHHQVLYFVHVLMYNSKFCAVFNRHGLIALQTMACAFSSAHTPERNELRKMIRDGSMARNFGLTLANVMKYVMAEKVLRHLHKSMIEKCGWQQDTGPTLEPATTKMNEDEFSGSSASPSAVTAMLIFAAVYLL